MKKLAIIILAAILLASCQSPLLTYDPKAKKYVESNPITATVTIVIE